MLTRPSLRRLVFVFGLFGIAGCGSNSPAAPASDFIALDSIVPVADSTLNAGDRVTFTAVVTCTIVNANGGFTALVLQDQGNRTLVDSGETPPRATLSKGTATVTLSQTITIPPSGSTVTASLPLFVDGSNSTAAVVRRTYSVR